MNHASGSRACASWTRARTDRTGERPWPARPPPPFPVSLPLASLSHAGSRRARADSAIPRRRYEHATRDIDTRRRACEEFVLGESLFPTILTRETTQSLVCVFDRDGAGIMPVHDAVPKRGRNAPLPAPARSWLGRGCAAKVREPAESARPFGEFLAYGGDGCPSRRSGHWQT